ncbi:MAG: RNA-binding S4 domain-containing protein [Gammaproteobacteria bacterium]|nr:RNA-binding S4 domain-containing protein [Gammaproteobacteria bacterium]
MAEEVRMRLDKWLWAARFFKTRQLAVEAINGGKVHLNGQRTKPGKEVGAGSRLRIHKNSLEWNVTVERISQQRRPAPEAATLYHEEEESVLQRKEATHEARLLRAAAQRPQTARPSKRDRRMIHRFTGK